MMAELQEYPRIVPRPSQGLPGQTVMVFQGSRSAVAVADATHTDLDLDSISFGASTEVPNLAADGLVTGFQIPRTGTYVIEASVSFSLWTATAWNAGVAAPVYYQARYGKNSVQQTWAPGGTPLGGNQVIVIETVKLTKDDTITLTTYHTYGSPRNTNVANITIYEVVT